MNKKNVGDSSQKPPAYNSTNINNVIKEIGDYFSKLKIHSIEINKIDKILLKYNVSRAELRESLYNNIRFSFDGQRIFRKKKYDISNESDLIELLKKRKDGLEEDNDLFDCYNSCKMDIDKMKEKGLLRIVENKSDNKKYLFLKNEKYNSLEYVDVLDKMKLKWAEVIEPEYSIKTREFEMKNKEKAERKTRRKKIRKIHNYWMIGAIDFREINKAGAE